MRERERGEEEGRKGRRREESGEGEKRRGLEHQEGFVRSQLKAEDRERKESQMFGWRRAL